MPLIGSTPSGTSPAKNGGSQTGSTKLPTPPAGGPSKQG